MNVLFLSVSAGGGHIKAAEAVKERIKEKFPQSKILIVDVFKYTSPLADKLIVGSYLRTVKSTPKIYGKLYSMSKSDERLIHITKAINRQLSFKLEKLINAFTPSVIVCTHVFSLQMASNLKQQGIINIPLIAILTDFSGHTFWKNTGVDAYVVPHQSIKQEMKSEGIDDKVIYPYGIPVSKSFLQDKNRMTLLKNMGFEDCLTVLLMGGSLGYGKLGSVFKSLLRCPRHLQIIVITGRNLKLKKKLERYSMHTHKKVKILEYTHNVSDYMTVSDFVITKPGGITISESLVKKLPIFIMSPIPGQEEQNANFLINNGAAVKISPQDNIESIISQVIDNPLRVKHMKEMAEYLSKPFSSLDILNLIEKLSDKS